MKKLLKLWVPGLITGFAIGYMMFCPSPEMRVRCSGAAYIGRELIRLSPTHEQYVKNMLSTCDCSLSDIGKDK